MTPIGSLQTIPADTGYIKTGTYTGDASVNKAIAHGLGSKFVMAIIQRQDCSTMFLAVVHTGYAFINAKLAGTNSHLAVTAPDDTNFYVGNATNYDNSANAAVDYRWWAFGAEP